MHQQSGHGHMNNTQFGRPNQVMNKMIINSKGASCESEIQDWQRVTPRLSKNRVGEDCAGTRSFNKNNFTHCSLVVAVAMT